MIGEHRFSAMELSECGTSRAPFCHNWCFYRLSSSLEATLPINDGLPFPLGFDRDQRVERGQRDEDNGTRLTGTKPIEAEHLQPFSVE